MISIKEYEIVISPQSYKESLSAWQASNAMRHGVLQVFPSADTILAPVADGGDGTLDVLKNYWGGNLRN